MQVCFTYASSTQCTWSQTPGTTIQRVPHAFGNGFPTADAGPGQVALWTGEFNTDATDISVPGYTGDLSISRSHSTYAGPANTVNGVFGPGWVAHFDGADAGAAGMEVVDSTRADGTIALVDGDGTALVYEVPERQRRTTRRSPPGPGCPPTRTPTSTASKLTVTGTGTGDHDLLHRRRRHRHHLDPDRRACSTAPTHCSAPPESPRPESRPRPPTPTTPPDGSRGSWRRHRPASPALPTTPRSRR